MNTNKKKRTARFHANITLFNEEHFKCGELGVIAYKNCVVGTKILKLLGGTPKSKQDETKDRDRQSYHVHD